MGTSPTWWRAFGDGTPARAGVLLMAHIDVVPARREDWSVDPWTLLERDGWFYGRGSTDNKAGAAMLVANFITLKRAGWQPARNLIIVLTGDEETAQKGIQTLLAEASRNCSMPTWRSTPTAAA